MTDMSIFRFKNHALMMALAAVYPTVSFSAGAARVDFAAGNVVAVNTAGAQRSVAKGAEIGVGEAVVTGDGGRAQLRFTDSGMVSLQPGTESKIDNYNYSGNADGEEKGFFSLLKGGMRTITGWVGRSNRSAYKVTTNVATIGIRGTEYTAGYGPGGNSLLVHTGEGLVEVCNGGGCVTLGSGESGAVGGQNQRPQRTETRPQLPPAQPETSALPVFSTSDILAADFIPTSPMPTGGTATYVLPVDAAQTGTAKLDSAKFDATFTGAGGSITASMKGHSVASGATFDFTANMLSGNISGNTFSASSSSGTGGLCGCTCSGSVSGTFFGSGAQQIGIDYKVTGTSTVGGSTVLPKQ